jgi:hypothetical protein
MNIVRDRLRPARTSASGGTIINPIAGHKQALGHLRTHGMVYEFFIAIMHVLVTMLPYPAAI